ncbi:hypothetical protein ACVNIS_06400 [Sphaerotilaceae bacterium SBD11-9]
MHHLSRLVLLTITVLVGACDLVNGAGHISQRIGETAKDPSASEVDIGKLTTFGWDRMYLFKPGTPKKKVCEFIEANEKYCDQVVRQESKEGESMTIAFSLANQITHIELHLLENGRFDMNPDDKGIEKSLAVFKIRRETDPNGKTMVYLSPK